MSADNPSSNNGLIKYASNSARTFKTTGWQLEVGDEATSYIKTDASQVTRAADDPSMIGANFSSWYRQDEGTFFAGASTNADVTSTSNRIDTISLSDGSQPNLIVVGPNTVGGSNILTTYASTDAVAQCVISAGLSGAKSYRFAVALSANNFAMSLNGSAALTDSVGTMPRSIDRLFIGRRSFTAAQYQNGHIKRITYYPKRLTDAQLQALTA